MRMNGVMCFRLRSLYLVRLHSSMLVLLCFLWRGLRKHGTDLIAPVQLSFERERCRKVLPTDNILLTIVLLVIVARVLLLYQTRRGMLM